MRKVKKLAASLLIGGFLAITSGEFSPREILLQSSVNTTVSAASATVPKNPLQTSKSKLQELKAKFPEYANSRYFYSDALTQIQAFEIAYNINIKTLPQSVIKAPAVITKSSDIRELIQDAKDLFNLLTSGQYQAAQETLRNKYLYTEDLDTTDGPSLRGATRDYLKQLADDLNSNLDKLEPLIKDNWENTTPAPTPTPILILLIGVNLITGMVILIIIGVFVLVIKQSNLKISRIPTKIQQLLKNLANNNHGDGAALSKLHQSFQEMESKLTDIDTKINRDNPPQSIWNEQFQQSSNQVAALISPLDNLTKRVEHLMASTQPLDIFELIQAFNQNPQLLQQQGLTSYEVVERPAGKSKRSSNNKDVFLEKSNTNKGDFWILYLGSHSYLFPKKKAIRESQKVIAQKLFQGYKPGDASNFILVKPAKVTPIELAQDPEWKLEAKGELKPERLESRDKTVEAEKEQLESKYHQQSRGLEKLQKQITTLSKIKSRYQELTTEHIRLHSSYQWLREEQRILKSNYEQLEQQKKQLESNYEQRTEEKKELESHHHQQTEEKKELESHHHQLEQDKEELQGKYNQKSEDLAKLTQDIAKLRQDHTEQLESKNQELQELALDREKLTQANFDLESQLQQQAQQAQNELMNSSVELERSQEKNKQQSQLISELTHKIVQLESQLQQQAQQARSDRINLPQLQEKNKQQSQLISELTHKIIQLKSQLQ